MGYQLGISGTSGTVTHPRSARETHCAVWQGLALGRHRFARGVDGPFGNLGCLKRRFQIATLSRLCTTLETWGIAPPTVPARQPDGSAHVASHLPDGRLDSPLVAWHSVIRSPGWIRDRIAVAALRHRAKGLHWQALGLAVLAGAHPTEIAPSVNAGLDQAVFARVPDGMTCVAVPCNSIDTQQRAALPIPRAQGPVVPGGEQPPAVWGEGAGPHPALVAGQGAQCRRRWWVGEIAMRGTWCDDGLRAWTGAPGGRPRGPGDACLQHALR